MFRVDSVWYMHQRALVADCSRRERARIGVTVTVQLNLRTVLISSGQTHDTVATRFLYVSEPNAIADLEGGHIASDLFDDADAFMFKGNLTLDAVFVCTADARVGDLDKDFGRPQSAGE